MSSDNLVSEDSDIYAKGASNSVGIGPDGKIMLGTTVTTGDTKVSLEQGVSLENTSVKYEVETALDDN